MIALILTLTLFTTLKVLSLGKDYDEALENEIHFK